MHGDAHRDARQPGREQRLAAKRRQRPEGFDEDGLHQVVQVRRRPDQPIDDAVHAADVGLEQRAEGGAVVVPRALDQRRHLAGRHVSLAWPGHDVHTSWWAETSKR